MRDRRDPWKWPACIGLTVALLLTVVFLVPASWIAAFFSPLSLAERMERERAGSWLAVLPPPVVESVADREPVPPAPDPDDVPPIDHRDPDWWSRGWVVQATPHGPEDNVRKAADDSVTILLAALGVERDFMARARPDSVLAARIFLLQVEDSFRFDEMKPYLTAMARARDYADIMSRAADMYDDFLRQEIMTPD
jgi:hypothetical protein